MRNILRVVIPVFLLLRFADLQAQAGYANIITDSLVNIPCGQTCTNLTATALGGALTTSYTVSQISYLPPFAFNSGTNVLNHTDDLWTSTINLPFSFCFFGNTFSKIIVGSNGEVSFNTQNAATFNNWSIPGAIPFTSEADQFNTIMAPWQDLDPTNRGDIYYNIGGVSPNQYFEVSWYHCPMYGDPNSVSTAYCTTSYSQTQMAVLYQTSNVIEVYIQQKGAPCTAWNGGKAIEGIMNGTGTVGYAVPGRNATQWGPVASDAWRFTPAGTATATLNWYLEPANTLVGTGNTVNVCPNPGSTHYLVTATYSACGSGTETISTNVFVGLSNLTVADSAVQPGCSSGNGSVFATISSTTGILSYGWAPGGANQTQLTNIGAGTYIFTATDSLGCVKRDTEVLGASGPLGVTLHNDTATSCTGTTNNGILDALVTGGVGPYTYAWTGGATTNPLTGLSVGTYTVTATDSHGCSGTASANVSVLTHALTFATPQITNVTCNGGSNGQIIAPVNGGTNPITFTWSPGSSTTDTLSNLIAGTYTVTAVDANNCSATASFTVTQPLTALSVTVPNDTVTSCTGQTNIGTLLANVTGGTPVYSYNWSNTLTTNPITGLAAGTYNVTVKDVFGCSAIDSGTVVTKVSSLSVTMEVANPICAGLKGQVVAVETGGVLPITYNWSTGRNVTDSLSTDTLNGVAGGTYAITVTDANGCSITASFVVNQPTPFIVTIPNDTINSCSGTTVNGTLTATSTGGTPNYTYLWSNTLTTNPITGLSAGNYTVTATDRQGCTVVGSGSVVVTGSPVVFNAPQLTNPGCSGTGGEIILSTSGGTPPITFTWSGGTTQNDTLVGLAGGTYAITATDVNGCSTTASYTLTQSSPIVFGTPVYVNVGCNGGTGSITANATGGSGTITYAWSGGTTGATVTGPAGGYIVTATDGSGCTATAAYSISQASPVAIDSADVVAASCSVDSGSISIHASGGTGTLTYTWSPGNLTGSNLINLNPGGYTVTVTDVNHCSATGYYIVGHSSCGGCPAVNTNNNVVIPCSDTCTQLTASAFSAAQTTAYTVAQIPYAPPFAFNTGTAVLVHTDDLWSACITLPFNFCFWGVTHNTITVGSNGEISFNCGNAGAFNNWSIPGPLPNANLQNDQKDVIMAPWQDLDPTYHGDIYYNISGTAPCRKFEVAWYDCPMFSDSGSVDNTYCSHLDHQTAMVVIYETTNAIDIYIKNKQVVCSDLSGGTVWNGGWAIEGIVGPGAGGTPNVIVPGRNATQWTAVDDAWRFTPAGAPNYTVQWFQNGNVIANTPTVTVCPPVPTTYTVQATYTNCDNSQVVVADSVYVTPGGTLNSAIDSVHTIVCNGDSDGAVYASYSTNGTVTSFGWNYPGGANQTSLVGIPAGTYIFTVTTTTCSKSDTVVLVNPPKVVVTLPNDTFNSCTTNNLGALSASVTGGTPGYTYLWSNSETTASLTGLTPGTYSVTVTDSHGCTGSATATVTRIQGNLAFIPPVVVNATCAAGGSITISTTGGTAPVTYTWSPTEPNTTTLTNLTAGQYCVTASDAGGCSISACFTITAPTPVLIDSSKVKNLTCNGADSGSIIVYASGGSGTLTYTWSPTEPNTNSLTGLAAGTYNVTVKDVNGCSATASYTITQPSPIANDSLVIVNVSCSASGSILAVDTGGVPPLSYNWSVTGQITDSLTNLQPGTYTLTVTDAHGCSITASYTVGTAPGALVFGPPVITPPSCNGGSNGSITVTATGGQGTITYAWGSPPGGNTNTITGLSAGTYTVTATDANGCSVSASYTVTQPTLVTFGNPVITPPSCNGGTNGSITATATGGTPGYTYLWTGGATTNPLTGLAAGVYCVTATDNAGCSASICYNVSQPTPVVIDSATINAVTCVNPGQIILGVSGGTPGYTFSWSSGATGGDTASVSAAGTVTVTVTDSHGCSATGSYTVGASVGAVTIDSSSITPITCNGNSNGQIIVHASDSAGGPITYVWSNGSTHDTISNLSAATYCVTVTDSLGCTASACYTLAQPAAIVFGTPVIVSPLCNGDSGSINVNATGGTGIITYTWPGQIIGAKDSNLLAGTYVVTATDANGCSATASYTITQPTAVTVTGTVDSITCNGANNGSITAVASGGVGPYTYRWTGGTTGPTLSNLSPGTYCVRATDANGCTASACFTLSEPPVLVIDTAVISKATCLVGGSVVVTASGGTPGYHYGWSSNASVTDSAGNIAPGSITVTVTDSKGCTVTATYTVPADTNVVVIDSAHIINDVCNGGNTGSITVTATGGTGTLHYAWSSPPGGSTDAITGLIAGTYTITVSDSLGCSASASYPVTQPSHIVVIVDSTQVTCTSLGSIYVIASGGTPGYTYAWGAPLNSTSDSVTGLNDGTYTVTVTDANHCTASGTGSVTTAPNSIVLSFDSVRPSCHGLSNGSVTVIATGAVGTVVYAWGTPPGGSANTISNVPAGTYCVTITDGNGCSKSACSTLGQPDSLEITNITVVAATCNTTGSLTAVVTGGTTAYSYQWTGTTNGTTNPLTGLTGGSTESVTVTDHNSCTVAGSQTLPPAPQPLTFAAPGPVVTDDVCHGGSTGSITFHVIGGDGNTLNYQWTPAETGDSTITGLAAGTYYLSITQSGGCFLADTFIITQPGPFTVAAGATPLVCPGDSDVACVTVLTGGEPGFTYAWSGGQNTQCATITGLTTTPAAETITVTDANQCTATASVTVAAEAQLTADTSGIVFLPCQGGSNVTIVGHGGSGPLSYNYTPGGTANSTGQFGLVQPGTYTYTISDSICSITGTFFVPQAIPAPSDSTSSDSTSCFGFSDGGLTVFITGDSVINAPFTYSINGGAFQSGNVFDSLAAGSYQVVVKTSGGCLDTIQTPVVVGQPAKISVSFSPDTIQGYANTAVSLAPNVVNAVNPVYSWSPTKGLNCDNCATDSATIAAPQWFYVTVSDSAHPTCSAYDSVLILLQGPLIMPNAFAPDGSNPSDAFFGPVSVTYVIVKEFHIYNRWGQLVHNSNTPWDGKFDGKPQPAGTYIYYIEGQYEDPLNAGHYLTGKAEGAVTLLR